MHRWVNERCIGSCHDRGIPWGLHILISFLSQNQMGKTGGLCPLRSAIVLGE